MKKLIVSAVAFVMAAACTSTQVQTTPEPTMASKQARSQKNSLEPTLVTLDSPSPLVSVRLMVKAGSTADFRGKEGLANMTADALLAGGFGDPMDPVTKEELAEITQPWGSGANPSNFVSAETTTFYMTVPREVLGTYLDQVLRPLFTSPLFAADEIERLKNEADAGFSSARFENLENLGLYALDMYVNEGTAYEHVPFGTERGVESITREDVLRFYEAYYRPGNMIVGVSTLDGEVTGPIMDVVKAINADVRTPMPPIRIGEPKMPTGRHAVVIEEPNAPAAGIHIGFPLSITREDPDFWPLYVAQTWFGTHRDSTGRLYQQIRQERGYNYGDYAYIEHWMGKPWSLFQVFNQPRSHQYFSIWIRPVQHDYAYHISKAATYELERLIELGLTDEEVAAAKNKAKVLYVNLAETVDRLLSARVDDAFYGMQPGFLEGYLERLERVTTADVNRAIRKHLQTENMKYVFITDSQNADTLLAQLRGNRPAYGKTLADYQITSRELEDGSVVYEVPESKLEMLRNDALWATEPLDLETVRRIDVDSVFATRQFGR